jgi:hypothetical protein
MADRCTRVLHLRGYRGGIDCSSPPLQLRERLHQSARGPRVDTTSRGHERGPLRARGLVSRRRSARGTCECHRSPPCVPRPGGALFARHDSGSSHSLWSRCAGEQSVWTSLAGRTAGHLWRERGDRGRIVGRCWIGAGAVVSQDLSGSCRSWICEFPDPRPARRAAVSGHLGEGQRVFDHALADILSSPPTRPTITQIDEGTDQIQRVVMARAVALSRTRRSSRTTASQRPNIGRSVLSHGQ